MNKHSPSKRFYNRDTKESMEILEKFTKGDKNANETIKDLQQIFLRSDLNDKYKKDILDKLKSGELTSEEAERKLHFFIRLEREFVSRNNSNKKPSPKNSANKKSNNSPKNNSNKKSNNSPKNNSNKKSNNSPKNNSNKKSNNSPKNNSNKKKVPAKKTTAKKITLNE
jgi:hypothetical protein